MNSELNEKVALGILFVLLLPIFMVVLSFVLIGTIIGVNRDNALMIDSDYIGCIKDTCKFFLEGEIFLNEKETKIIEMNIFSLSYVNENRMDTSTKLFTVI